MSNLPRIPSVSPVVVPAVEATTYPDLYLSDLMLSTGDAATDQQITVGFRPYNYDSKTIAPRMQFGPMNPTLQGLRLPAVNIWAEAQRSTLFAQAMGAVIQYAMLAAQEFQLSKQITALLAPYAGQMYPDAVQAAVAALQAALAEVRAGMGVT